MPATLPCTRNKRRRRTHWLHCLQYHHPPLARPFAIRPQPARPPAARAITRSPCTRSRDAASQPHPSSQHPLSQLVVLISPTNPSSSPHPNARLPSRPRTWPPAPHGHPHARHSSLHRTQRRRPTHWLHCLHCHHPRPATLQLHSSVPEEPVLSLPQPAPDPIRGTRSGAVTRHPDQSQRTVYPWRACQTTPPATSKHHPGVRGRDPAP